MSLHVDQPHSFPWLHRVYFLDHCGDSEGLLVWVLGVMNVCDVTMSHV